MRNPILQQRLRAARWRLLERLRESLVARLALGGADLLRALGCLARGRRYRALEAASRIPRILALPGLDAAALALMRSVLRRTSLDARGRARPLAENQLIPEFLAGPSAAALASQNRFETWARLVRMGGELLLLKPADPASGELGVLILKYTGSFGRFHAVYDVASLFDAYQLVLEPSWIGYQDPVFYLYLDASRKVVVEAQYRPDYEVLEALGQNLVPVPLGAGHWVDPEHFHPLPGVAKDYLAVLIANWAPHKRHELLLDALARIPDPSARIALVGYPWQQYTRERIEAEVERRGLGARVDLYERISRRDVNAVLNRSRCNLVLSRKEGASKVFYEGLAANTPCLVIDDHDGVSAEHVNERTGCRASAGRLHEALLAMRAGGDRYEPAAWWREHASIPVSTGVLERALRADAAARGRPWRRGLAQKKNDPNLCYVDPELYTAMLPAYRELARHLRPRYAEALAALPPTHDCRT